MEAGGQGRQPRAQGCRYHPESRGTEGVSWGLQKGPDLPTPWFQTTHSVREATSIGGPYVALRYSASRTDVFLQLVSCGVRLELSKRPVDSGAPANNATQQENLLPHAHQSAQQNCLSVVQLAPVKRHPLGYFWKSQVTFFLVSAESWPGNPQMSWMV